MLMQSPASSEAELVQSSSQATTFGPDEYVLDWMVDHRTDTWTTVMKAITTLGNTVTLFVVATVVTVAFAYARKGRLALFVGLGSAVGSLLMVALKELFSRDRPPVPERMIDL